MVKIFVACCVFFSFSLKGYTSSDKYICDPQEFTEKIHTYCCYNNIDDFLGWLEDIDLPSMNRTLKDSDGSCIPSSIETEEEKQQLRAWKTTYYQKFKLSHQTKPFFLAGEFYPFNALVNSVALSFSELSAVMRTCILISGKSGNPVALNILHLENIDGESTEDQLVPQLTIEDNDLVELLQTPFLWNSLKVTACLKEHFVERVFDLAHVEHPYPFLHLNAAFLADDIGDMNQSIHFFQKACEGGFALAAFRLHQMREATAHFRKTVLLNSILEAQQAYVYRYQHPMNRHAALTCYVNALKHLVHDPFLHRQSAELHQDLYIGAALEEIEKTQDEAKHSVVFHYMKAHQFGDATAALTAIEFLMYLQNRGTLFPDVPEYGVSSENELESLTKLYEYAYRRSDDSLLWQRIKELGQRTETQMDALEGDIIRSLKIKNIIKLKA